MSEHMTNLQLANRIGDMQGAIGRIEGLLVGISADLLKNRAEFTDIDIRLRGVETSIPADIEKRLRAVETKLAVYAAFAAVIGAVLGYGLPVIINNLFV